MRARVGVRESHRDMETLHWSDREIASKSQIEPAGAKMGVRESHREPERASKRQREQQRESV